MPLPCYAAITVGSVTLCRYCPPSIHPSTTLLRAPSLPLPLPRSHSPSSPHLLYSLATSRLIPNLSPPLFFPLPFFEDVLLNILWGRFLISVSLFVSQPWKQKAENRKHQHGKNIHGRLDADCGLWSMVNVATISLSSVILKASVFVSYQYTCHCVIHNTHSRLEKSLDSAFSRLAE
jgi:hypothetical protein